MENKLNYIIMAVIDYTELNEVPFKEGNVYIVKNIPRKETAIFVDYNDERFRLFLGLLEKDKPDEES